MVNLGGATLDLGGGEFLVSAPLVIPPHVGNVRIRGGTLRASASFPPTRFLIEIGEDKCNTGWDATLPWLPGSIPWRTVIVVRCMAVSFVVSCVVVQRWQQLHDVCR